LDIEKVNSSCDPLYLPINSSYSLRPIFIVLLWDSNLLRRHNDCKKNWNDFPKITLVNVVSSYILNKMRVVLGKWCKISFDLSNMDTILGHPKMERWTMNMGRREYYLMVIWLCNHVKSFSMFSSLFEWSISLPKNTYLLLKGLVHLSRFFLFVSSVLRNIHGL